MKKYTSCTIAVENGVLECLKYLHENDYPWDEDTCEYAAKYGYLECLKYAHENGCLWGYETYYKAAKNGHLEILKYADEHECYNSITCKYDSCYAHGETPKFILGFILHTMDDVYKIVKKRGHKECAKYICEKVI